MLTLFTTPKAFAGEFATIQHNAIRSWTLLRPACELVFFGDDEGTAAAAARYQARHVATLERTDRGTPIVSALFQRMADLAETEVVAYVNADIVLMTDFLQAVERVSERFSRFLMVGQRRNIQVTEPLEFAGPWEAKLRELASGGDPYYAGIDYFVFPRRLWGAVPPFALGRLYWDSWLLYAARRRRAVVVDTTPVVLAVHQDHAYAPGQLGGDESRSNWRLAGGARDLFTTREATHVLTPDGVNVRCRSCYPACVCAYAFARPHNRSAPQREVTEPPCS